MASDNLPQAPNIVWIASYPKSGNTWIRFFLSALTGFDQSAEKLKTSTAFGFQCTSKAVIARALGELPQYDDAKAVVLDRARVQRAISARASPKTVFVKTHSYAGPIAGAEMIDGSVSKMAIVIVRNPFDVCRSAASHFGIPFDKAAELLTRRTALLGKLEEGQDRFPLAMSSWAHHVRSWLARRDMRIMLVRYEDMSRIPLTTFSRIARGALSINDEAKVLKALIQSDFESLRKLEEEKGFDEKSAKAERFFLSGKVGKGFDALSREQRDRLYADSEAICRALGYHYDGEALHIGPVDHNAVRRFTMPVVKSVRDAMPAAVVDDGDGNGLADVASERRAG